MPYTSIQDVERIRQQKAIIRKEVRRLPREAGQELVAELLLHPPVPICNMQVGYFLQWVHGLGPTHIEPMLKEVNAKWSDQIYREDYRPNWLNDIKRRKLAELVRNWKLTPEQRNRRGMHNAANDW